MANAEADLGRLINFFRGHRKSVEVLQHCQVKLLSIQMTIQHLNWDPNCSEADINSPTATAPTPLPSRTLATEAHPDRAEANPSATP